MQNVDIRQKRTNLLPHYPTPHYPTPHYPTPHYPTPHYPNINRTEQNKKFSRKPDFSHNNQTFYFYDIGGDQGRLTYADQYSKECPSILTQKVGFFRSKSIMADFEVRWQIQIVQNLLCCILLPIV